MRAKITRRKKILETFIVSEECVSEEDANIGMIYFYNFNRKIIHYILTDHMILMTLFCDRQSLVINKLI